MSQSENCSGAMLIAVTPVQLPRKTLPFPLHIRRCVLVVMVFASLLVSGCNRLHPVKHEYVYVVARQTYLRDRVAAVSNRTGQVANGDRLEVLEHGRRFLKVKSPKNEIGWIEDHSIIDAETFDQFTAVASHHKSDPLVARAVVRDEVFLHLEPGRNTQRFFLLPENSKVQLLVRASVPKVAAGTLLKKAKPGANPNASAQGSATPPAKPAAPSGTVASQSKPGTGAVAPIEPPAPPPMEDWWLVRDDKGQVGWLLSGRIDVEVPDSVGQYAEGQRVVGTYVLTTVQDDAAEVPNHEVPEYVMVLEPMKAALPYDFDQVRVFTWSRGHHRYETAFRLRPIQGFLPVTISKLPGPTRDGAMVPAFSIRIAANPNVSVDPDTGITRPAQTRTLNFVMLDTVVRRVGPDMDPIPSMHSAGEKKEQKGKKPAKSRKH